MTASASRRRDAASSSALMLSARCLVAVAAAGCNAGRATRPYIVAERRQSDARQAAHPRLRLRRLPHHSRRARGARPVGPPLFYLGQRTMIAGELPNTADNLAHWIEHPKQVNPNTAMPDLGLSEDQAYDIAAYLYSLEGPEQYQWSN